MISLSKTGNAIKFTFTDNGHYLQNGTIEVPVNSLTLVTDDSDMFTFKKSATNDIFVSGLYSEIGMTKAELETYYKNNMVGSTGGGGDITSGEVQTMIDESISGKADTSAVTESINEAVSGKVDSTAFTAYSGSVDSRILENEKVTAAALNVLNTNKLDASAYTPTDLSEYWTSAQTNSAITSATSGKVDTSTYNTYTAATDTALNGKQATLVSGTNIKTINNESILGSGNIDIQGGGGKAVSGGTNISITTGTTADTINCTLPIKISRTNSTSIIIGNTNQTISSNYSVAEGSGGFINDTSNTCHKEGIDCKINSYASASHVEGNNCEILTNSSYSHAEGNYTKTANEAEHASGQYNVSNKASYTFGNSGNTLFSVGNGTANNARHNAFEIRQNGDIYLSLNGQDVKLQDQLGGSSITVDNALDDSSENPVQNKVLYDELRLLTEGESGLTLEWDNHDGGETTNYPSGSGCSKITFEVVVSGETEGDEWYQDEGWFTVNDVEGNIHIAISDDIVTASAENGFLGTCSVNGNIVTVEYPTIADDVTIWYSSYDNHWTTTAYINSTVYTPLINQVSANTAAISDIDDRLSEDEEVTARALVDLNDKFDGLKLKKITQTDYDNLQTKDANTLYIIVN